MENNKKLTNIENPKNTGTLTSDTIRKFSVLFSDEIENSYALKKLEKSDSHKLTRFLHVITNLSWNDADKKYLRKSDITDKKDGHEIIHYGFSGEFRVHGYQEKGMFIITRIDPNHKVHK